MEANFQRALDCVLEHEGGWADNPRDPGGATNKGITLTTYRQYEPHASKDDLRSISDRTVARIYRAGYWNTVEGDKLPTGVDYAVFDFAVNSGPGRAARYLQRICGVKVDGAIGPVTLKAVNALDADFIINELCNDRLEFLRGLKTWSTFGRGWANRVESVRAGAMEMAALTAREDPAPGPDPRPSASVGKDHAIAAAVGAAVTAAIVAVASWAGDLWHTIIGALS